MQLDEAVDIIVGTVENPNGVNTTRDIAMACAVVLARTGLLGARASEIKLQVVTVGDVEQTQVGA